MKISIEIVHSDGKDKLQLIDPTEVVQEFAVSAFFGYCREMNGEAKLLIKHDNKAKSTPVIERPDWYDTGIKLKDGVPHYRARYWCQKSGCSHQGSQYVRLDAEITECHECKTKLKIRPAIGVIGDDGVPGQDRFGNFFRADRLAE